MKQEKAKDREKSVYNNRVPKIIWTYTVLIPFCFLLIA